MQFLKDNWKGIILCFALSLPCWFLGKAVPVVGAPVFGILLGMALMRFLPAREQFQSGIAFTSKKVLQYAVILLGFGLNLGVVLETGKQSLPIICSTITISLVMAWILRKLLRVPGKIATLIGVGSSIGIFAGTAVNDTSSVTATASTWDSLYGLGSQTLDKAVTVKLTRTLAIIPITLVLSLARTKREKAASNAFSFRRAFPMFILWFIVASLITTICTTLGVSASVFVPLKTLSKFFIVMAMTAIGLNTDIVRIVKNGGKSIALGFGCWAAITAVSLLMQYAMGIM